SLPSNIATGGTSIRLRRELMATRLRCEEDLLYAVRQPDPPRPDDINPQHQVGIAKVEVGYDNFGVADRLSRNLQSGKPMNAPVQLFWPGAAEDCRTVTGE